MKNEDWNTILTPESIREEFVRSSGPGGQNVNKVSTAVRLYFDVEASTLSTAVKHRLRRLAGSRLSSDDCIIIFCESQRSQSANRETARKRLRELILKAMEVPKPRRKTKPTGASKERRLKAKRLNAEKKRARTEKFHE